MGILIGHASISEKGTAEGAKGDSTGREVCTRTWYVYSGGWDYIAVHPDTAVREKHAKAVEDVCENDCVGYGQSDRNSAYAEAKKVNFVIKNIKTKCNTDCSALQNLAAVVSGAKGVTYGSNGWTTSTMLKALIAAGYIIIAKSTSITGYSGLTAAEKKKVIAAGAYLLSAEYCVRGAIYVKAGSHTVAGLNNGSKASQTLAKAQVMLNGDVNAVEGSKYMFEVGLIKNGSKGVQVLLFQRIAKATGDYTGDLDSEYGSLCMEACKKIQKRAGFTGKDVDGECGSKTWPVVLGV